MTTYVDTSVLIKTYVLEPDSAVAVALLDTVGEPFTHSHLHELELPNALRLKRFRGEISSAQLAGALAMIDSDRAEGRLVRPDYDLAEVFTVAASLAARHTAAIGARSLDLLHLAMALECGCTHLASFDERQRRAADREGLALLPAHLPALG